MGAGTGLRLTDDGQLVVVKRSPVPGGRLEREAEILRRAAHPGVVRLVTFEAGAGAGAGAGELSLATAFVGGAGLDLGPGQPGRDLLASIGVLAALASTLADLHDRGISHRRLSADHVLVPADGRAVLCGLAGATLPSDSQSEIDEGRRADVAALGAMARELASGRTTRDAVALDRLGQRTQAVEEETGPSMRSLAAALDELAPGDAIERPDAPSAGRRLLPAESVRRGRSGRSRRPALGVVVAVAVLAGGGAVVAMGGLRSAVPVATPGADGARPTSARPTSARPTSTVPASTVPASTVPAGTADPAPSPGVRVWPPAACEPAPEPAADIDGDGCAEPLHVHGGVLTAAGSRWRVAEADDLVVVGHWACNGRATPAVVRPGTGGVWIYAGWAGDGQTVAAERVGSVAGALTVTAVRRPGAGGLPCDDLEVTDAEGVSTVVPTAG